MLTHTRIGHTKRDREYCGNGFGWRLIMQGGDRELKRVTSFPCNKKKGDFKRTKLGIAFITIEDRSLFMGQM